jgi:hypothetical protein
MRGCARAFGGGQEDVRAATTVAMTKDDLNAVLSVRPAPTCGLCAGAVCFCVCDVRGYLCLITRHLSQLLSLPLAGL